MKIHHDLKKRLFIARIFYWNTIFYFLLIVSSILFWIIEKVMIKFFDLSIPSILFIIMLFFVNTAVVLSLCNSVCALLLRPSVKYIFYFVIWVLFSFLTIAIAIIVLFQTVLIQGRGI